MNIILFGPPGSGKGTQTQLLSEAYNIPRIVTGDILRQKAKESTEIANLLKAGDFVPDEMICELVCEKLKASAQKGYLLDGFPRTLHQAKYLENMGITPDIMIVLTVPDQELVRRLGGRRLHPGSGRTYHIDTLPPKEAGKDDITGEPLIIRSDDQVESIKNRLKIYHSTTYPIIEHYQSLIKVVALDGEQSPQKVFEAIKAEIA